MFCFTLGCSVALTQGQRQELARVIEGALTFALGQHGWTWDMAAKEMLLDPAQLHRMRTGQEGFDVRRLMLLPAPIFAAVQTRLMEQQGAVEDAAPHILASLCRSWLASRSTRMARATVPGFEARKVANA